MNRHSLQLCSCVHHVHHEVLHSTHNDHEDMSSGCQHTERETRRCNRIIVI